MKSEINKRVKVEQVNKTRSAKAVRRFFDDKKVEKRIADVLLTIGIATHLQGHKCIRVATRLCMDNRELLRGKITKVLYPEVSRILGSSAAKVERSIRTAIRSAFEGNRFSRINGIFGVPAFDMKYQPKSNELISFLTDQLLFEFEEG